MTEPSQNQLPHEGDVVAMPGAGLAALAAGQPQLTVNLQEEENEVGRFLEPKERAVIFGMYADTWSRIGMVIVMAVIFVGLNWMVLVFLRDAFSADVRMLESKPPILQAADRLITANVLMTLIGATVVQVGVSIAAIVSYLFPKTSGNGSSSQ
jgi:hypothetical protein